MASLSKIIEPKTWAFLEALEAKGGKPLYELSIQDARNVLIQVQAIEVSKLPVAIEDINIPGNPEVSVRIVRPEGSADKLLPVILYIHGGGWVLGDKKTHDRLVREIAVGVNAALVFVNYTPSPEAKFPVAIEQAYAALKYVAEHGKELSVDPSRIIVVGDSVGGNMAAAVTLLAKERGGPKLLYQVLFYPVTDCVFDTATYREFAEGPWLTKKAMEWFWDLYLPDKEARKQPHASPLRATVEQLKNLPPALVIVDESDVLREEGEAYAHKLNEAGVRVTALRQLGTIHDFVMLNPLANTPATRNAIGTAIAHLKICFRQNKLDN